MRRGRDLGLELWVGSLLVICRRGRGEGGGGLSRDSHLMVANPTSSSLIGSHSGLGNGGV